MGREQISGTKAAGLHQPHQLATLVQLLLSKRCNLCKVLARSTTFFHLSLFCATFFSVVYIHTPYISQNAIFSASVQLADCLKKS
jgi:hypothetical protein